MLFSFLVNEVIVADVMVHQVPGCLFWSLTSLLLQSASNLLFAGVNCHLWEFSSKSSVHPFIHGWK